jgi:hypothetical protein
MVSLVSNRPRLFMSVTTLKVMITDFPFFRIRGRAQSLPSSSSGLRRISPIRNRSRSPCAIACAVQCVESVLRRDRHCFAFPF